MSPRLQRWPLRGGSMRPLGAGWTAVVAPGALRRGDLVCYLSASGRACVHRVHALGRAAIVVRGDSAGPEPEVPQAAIVGRVVALERGGLRLPLPAGALGGAIVRAVGLAWAAAAPGLLPRWDALRAAAASARGKV
jgi:hypothetical protein